MRQEAGDFEANGGNQVGPAIQITMGVGVGAVATEKAEIVTKDLDNMLRQDKRKEALSSKAIEH